MRTGSTRCRATCGRSARLPRPPDGELADRIGHVLHCAAKVVFTEPYRTLREDNVLTMVDLLGWMRAQGVRDFSFVSSVAATGPAMGADERFLETSAHQSLDPRLGGYGVSKWVGERLLDRADADGMRVRIFRPGLIMASSEHRCVQRQGPDLALP